MYTQIKRIYRTCDEFSRKILTTRARSTGGISSVKKRIPWYHPSLPSFPVTSLKPSWTFEACRNILQRKPINKGWLLATELKHIHHDTGWGCPRYPQLLRSRYQCLFLPIFPLFFPFFYPRCRSCSHCCSWHVAYSSFQSHQIPPSPEINISRDGGSGKCSLKLNEINQHSRFTNQTIFWAESVLLLRRELWLFYRRLTIRLNSHRGVLLHFCDLSLFFQLRYKPLRNFFANFLYNSLQSYQVCLVRHARQKHGMKMVRWNGKNQTNNFRVRIMWRINF